MPRTSGDLDRTDRHPTEEHGLSRRQFLGAAAGAALAIGADPSAAAIVSQGPRGAGASSAGGRAQPDLTLVLVNGRIHTMDARDTVVTTFSMRNGRFVSVGGAAPPRGPNTRVIDLRGRTVVPGLVE